MSHRGYTSPERMPFFWFGFPLVFQHFPVGSGRMASIWKLIGLIGSIGFWLVFECFWVVFWLVLLHFPVGSPAHANGIIFQTDSFYWFDWFLIGFRLMFYLRSCIFRSVAVEWSYFENWSVFDKLLNAFRLFFDWLSCLFRSIARCTQMVLLWKRIHLIGLIVFWLVFG